jgi:hypothetical protein
VTIFPDNSKRRSRRDVRRDLSDQLASMHSDDSPGLPIDTPNTSDSRRTRAVFTNTTPYPPPKEFTDQLPKRADDDWCLDDLSY